MEHSWSVEDFNIQVTDSSATGVVCVYCNASVPFAQPDYSTDPGDVHITPEHTCSAYPEDPPPVELAEPVLVDASTGDVIDPSTLDQG